MNTVRFPYGRSFIEHTFDEGCELCVLRGKINEYVPDADESALVEAALARPVGSERLSVLAKGKKKITVIASDHTRPVPSRILMPALLREIRLGSPDAEITILIATGCHRETTLSELEAKFGSDIVRNERIIVHDCDDAEHLRCIGKLPSGGACVLNSVALDADLLVSEGFIEPHFFAGYSGGRKSVLPGVASRETVLANHCSEFIAHPNARTGCLEGNPIHEDMLWAAKEARLAFILNVVLNEDKKIIFAAAGDVSSAHGAGVEFLSSLCRVSTVPADVVVTTNGGYPLDQNVYQSVKGMTAGEAAVKKGGVIIMCSESGDGIGGEHFYRQLADEADVSRTMTEFLKRQRGETVPDQWQTQIMLRVLMHATVIYISSVDDETVRQMHMIPAHSIGEALDIAKKLLGQEKLSVNAIHDGVSFIVK